MYSVYYIQTLAISSNEGMGYMGVRYTSLWNMAVGWAELACGRCRKSESYLRSLISVVNYLVKYIFYQDASWSSNKVSLSRTCPRPPCL